MDCRLRRHALTDDQWRLIAPLLPVHSGPGRPPKDHRLVVEGIVWILRTGAPWRDLPERFGPWKTVYERFRGWTRSGIWSDIFERLKASNSRLVERPDDRRRHSHPQGPDRGSRLRQGLVPREKCYRTSDRVAEGVSTAGNPLRKVGASLSRNADARDDPALLALRSAGDRHILESMATTETRTSLPR